MRKTLVPAILTIIVLALAGCASEELTSAKLYIQQENWEKAEEFLLKAMVVEPENPEIPYLLGQKIYARRSDWKKMNEMFDKALEIGADKAILQGGLVRDYVKNSRAKAWADAYNDAVTRFNKIRTVEGEEREKALDSTIEGFETALLIDPSETQTYPILSLVYIEKGYNDKALELLSQAQNQEFDDPKLLVTLGQSYIRLGVLEDAVTALNKALELDPSNLAAAKLLAQTWYDLDNLDMAIQTYEKAIELEKVDIKKADLHFNLGILYMKAGNITMAEDNFTYAYDLNPDDVESLVGIAQTFEQAEKWKKAEKYYKELVYLEPDNPEHYRSMARVLIKQGRPEEATRYFEKSKKVGQ
ncbi:MAG: tetratricopeptide repeat protein [Fidelibacterota bacterium]